MGQSRIRSSVLFLLVQLLPQPHDDQDDARNGSGPDGAPVVDWLDYDTHYTERYLGMPDTDAAAYREGSLLTYAAHLERPLLLVHGTSDDNVFFRHTLKLTDALFRAGKYFELLPLSGLTHMVPDPVITEQLWSRVASHFQKHLGKAMDGRN